jgi:hypothetical protein
MKLEELEARLKALEKRTQKLQDIEDIKTLQKSYGYYLEHWMADEIIDLFSDSPDVSLTLAAGTYLGKKSIIKYFKRMKDPPPEFLHQVMQLSGIVTVAPNGKTAKGRWYGFGLVAMSSGKATRQMFMGGIYGGEYIKEDGKWRFKSLRFDQIYTATPADGWAKPERTVAISPQATLPRLDADIPRKVNFRYPSGNIVPFYYKHPVTGKETSEKKYNATIKKAKS